MESLPHRALWLAWPMVLAVAAAGAQPVQVDPRIEPYRKVSGISGRASSIGSDTMANLMVLWLEGFQGTAQLGPMSRAMTATETDPWFASSRASCSPARDRRSSSGTATCRCPVKC